MTISANTRNRVVVLLTSIALALTLLLAGAVVARADDAAGSAPVASAEAPTTTHVVRSGDTLWEIAADHLPAGDDVRVLIEDIKRINGLSTSVIVPGQTLLIPLGS